MLQSHDFALLTPPAIATYQQARAPPGRSHKTRSHTRNSVTQAATPTSPRKQMSPCLIHHTKSIILDSKLLGYTNKLGQDLIAERLPPPGRSQ
jgi:hypothetical protein